MGTTNSWRRISSPSKPLTPSHEPRDSAAFHKAPAGDFGGISWLIALCCSPRIRCCRAFELSSTRRIGVYDCVYVALAEQQQCRVVTADERLLNAFPAQTFRSPGCPDAILVGFPSDLGMAPSDLPRPVSRLPSAFLPPCLRPARPRGRLAASSRWLRHPGGGQTNTDRAA